MTKLIAKGELARLAQVSPAAVSNALKRTNLDKALVGKKLNADHIEVTRFLKRQLSNRQAKLDEKSHDDDPDPNDRINPNMPTEEEVALTRKMLTADVRRLERMPFIEVLQAFGTEKNLLDFLRALQMIEKISESRLKNAQAEGILVSRTLVQQGIIDRINNTHTRLLTDGAKSIAREMYIMVKNEKTEDDCEVFTREQMTRYLKPMRENIERSLESTDLDNGD